MPTEGPQLHHAGTDPLPLPLAVVRIQNHESGLDGVALGTLRGSGVMLRPKGQVWRAICHSTPLSIHTQAPQLTLGHTKNMGSDLRGSAQGPFLILPSLFLSLVSLEFSLMSWGA